MINELSLPNFGISISKLPNDLYIKIKDECLNYLNKEEFISGITSKNVPKHYYLDKCVNELFEFLSPIIRAYLEKYDYIKNFNFLAKSVPLAFTKPWFNFQKKSEFIPNHIHDGILSYTIWIQLPKLNETKEKRFDGCFEFHYNDIVGNIRRHLFFLDKTYEGKIILFPWNLAHCVYPFYDSEEIRISVSGNINLNNS